MRLLLALALALAAPAHAADDVDAMLRDGRVGAAVPVIERAAKDHPGDVEAQERWIDLMLSLGAPQPVLDHYAARASAESGSADAWYLLGRASLDAARSLEAYQKALALSPGHARALAGVGAVHRANGELDQAVTRYQQALEADPSLEEAWSALLAIYVTHGQREEARALAEVAVTRAPSLTEPYLVLALLSADRAEAILTKASQAAPDPRVDAALAELYLGQGRPDDALRHAEQALAARPAMSGARLAGMFARSMKAGTLDVAGYRELVDLKGVEADDPFGARKRYDALVARYPRSPLPWMSRARLRAVGDLPGARADLERAVSLQPVEPEATAALGLLLVQTDPDRAARLLEPSAVERPYDASLQAAFARAAIAAGRAADARARLDDVARLHPYDVDVALLHAHACSAVGDKERAYDLLVDAADRIPDVRVPMARAAAAFETGRHDEAIRIYDRLYELTRKPMFAEAAEHVRQARKTTGGGQ